MLDDDDHLLAVIGFAAVTVVGVILGFVAIILDAGMKVLK